MTSCAVGASGGAQVAVCEADPRRTFQVLDRDGDGALSFEEFLGNGQDLPAGNNGAADSAAPAASSATSTAATVTPTAPTASTDAATEAGTPDFMAELDANLLQMQEMFAALDAAIAGINAYMTNPSAGSPPDDFFNYTPRTV
jgi:EF hand